MSALGTAVVSGSDAWAMFPARIKAVRPEIQLVSTYELELENAEVRRRFAFRSGQFNMLYLPGIGEAAISISSDPDDNDSLLHTVRAVGNVTRALARLDVGDQIMLRGPFGSHWPADEAVGRDLVIAAGGLGLAPLRPVIYEVVRHRDRYRRVTILYGARTPADLLYAHEYEAWRGAGLDVRTTVDLGNDQWKGRIGVVTTLLDSLTLDPSETRLFTCGPEIMMRFVIYAALDRKLSREHIFLSMERNMNCAVGLCGHCQFGPVFVCKEGPVFRYDRMEPFLAVEDF
ncbi:MAG TPA: FAD/NAD(P)-binding protein [Planctomycetaceae bacterium]|nr:FAD/NAD(P)-binding protein [Planctomycetaceae bacterium]